MSQAKLNDLRSALHSLNSSATALPLTGHATPFTKLSFEQRELAVQKWALSSINAIKSLYNSLGSLCIMLTYSQPALGNESIYWSASGYPGPDPLRDTKKLSLNLNEYQFLEVPAQGATVEYDVVIVGTGAGGGVVAGRLASAGLKVLVLEKGQFYNMDQLSLTEAESYHYLFEGNGSVVSEDGGLTLLAGSTFGGGTFVNWSASLAPPHDVREEWSREYGLPYFESTQFQRNIDAVCKRLGVSDAHLKHNLANEALLIACKRLGYPSGNIPQNTANSRHDCGWCTFGCSNGGKQSTAVTWLQDAQQHGAHFAVNCYVQEVITNNGRAEGVIAHVNGSPLVVKAKRVVVSAGALNSPLILERSGLKNKNIGRTLRVHPVYIASGYFPNLEIDQFSGSIMTAISGIADRRQGTGYGAKLEILAGHPVLGSFLRSWKSGESHKTSMVTLRNQITVAILIRDKDSVARVFADKETQKPCVEFSLGKFDAESGVEGVQAATKILVALGAKEVEVPFPGMKPFVADYLKTPSGDDSTFPNVELKDPAKLAQFLDDMGRINFKQLSPMVASAHIMGSCRMGTSPKVSVVNPKGETWETKGLYVADGSVFPTPSGVNPMITIQSVAYSIAEFIKEDIAQAPGSKL
ncbi:long-chain fatty alcohol dehydrogenase [Basidiobolus meristosporus CBS 931.73]|uniref:Long-chain-alcohol oxidase n=1 Tax=Basidiobolus meristosporus CBS 931.73 TaxID=1314790 RepID=A0A1Y1YRX4_9FUNG|nr:long-chain fatty alcohol dehydrogenase [Basidiobolus meristosporus CBS 931.73]|eukprot:ORY00781.1 long-chain fatty alcohol dehydrogenase [Basidiobolus meristosporus CBS 931.73]